ncbi:nucleotidyltransferase domain-containing protein [bacterium]|nr:nucleotidyltransferase domain-containing protein [bacterium]
MTTAGVQKKIKIMIERVVEKYHPIKIILFGSYARGTNTRDSDVDLLIIMEHVRSKHEQQIAIRMLLQDVGVSKDIIVTSNDEFRRNKNIIGTVAYPAAREGKILYAR